MSSPSYNNPSKRLHPPPARSAFFASAQAARASGSTSPLSSTSSSSSSSSSQSSQQVTSKNLQNLVVRPENNRNPSISSNSSASSTASSVSGASTPASPRTFSPASLSKQQATVEQYRNRYASYLAASWGISPSAAGVEFEHILHTRPGQHWPQPDRH